MMSKRFLVRILVPVSATALIASAACGGGDDDDHADARVIVDAPPAADSSGSIDGAVSPDGPVAADAGADAAPGASTQIEEARNAADGTVDITISGAYVTYLRPQVGSAPAGFFIQAVQMGPALLIEVDPAGLSPVPVVGDEVELTVTEMDTYGTARMATAITDFSRLSQSNDISGLVQDVTAATDLVSAVGSYESELITLDGTVVSDFTADYGSGHMGAQIETTGVTGNANLVLRVPQGLLDVVDIVNGCTFTLVDTPMVRYDSTAEASAWRAPDITLTDCPAPRVVSAVATSSTSVVVTFDHHLDAGSVLANGSQFTFDNGLTASAAAASGKEVTVTTTAQAGGTSYTVTVANTVTDTSSVGVDAAHNAATFDGFQVAAVLRINELNGNISSGCDLIELRVMTGGTMNGIKLYERTGSVLEFTSFTVAAGDIIVVHFDGNDTTNCNLNSSGNETTAVDELAASSYGKNYDTAWDWYSTDTGIAATNNVFTLYDAFGNILDAVFVADASPCEATVGSGTTTQAGVVATAGEWEQVGGGIPAGGFVDDDFCANAALDLDDTGTTSTGESIQRNDDDDNNDKADWVQAASSFGARNSGQTTP